MAPILAGFQQRESARSGQVLQEQTWASMACYEARTTIRLLMANGGTVHKVPPTPPPSRTPASLPQSSVARHALCARRP
jgi:hypothetical protein